MTVSIFEALKTYNYLNYKKNCHNEWTRCERAQESQGERGVRGGLRAVRSHPILDGYKGAGVGGRREFKTFRDPRGPEHNYSERTETSKALLLKIWWLRFKCSQFGILKFVTGLNSCKGCHFLRTADMTFWIKLLYHSHKIYSTE